MVSGIKELTRLGYVIIERKEDAAMIYAVDFDGTLSMGEWPEVGPANTNLFDFLIRKQMQGDKMILWTCRAGKPLQEAVDFCRDNGLVFDAVNDNLPETIEKYGSNSRKITCDIYLDDRACQVDEYDILNEISEIRTGCGFREKVIQESTKPYRRSRF